MKNNFTFYLWADAEKSIGLGHLNRIDSYPNVYWPIIVTLRYSQSLIH